MNTPTLFTPNVNKGEPDKRYRLYRHTDSAGNDEFSATEQGERFEADVVPDACGAGCFCGAWLTPLTCRGMQVLLTAEVF